MVGSYEKLYIYFTKKKFTPPLMDFASESKYAEIKKIFVKDCKGIYTARVHCYFRPKFIFSHFNIETKCYNFLNLLDNLQF